jgi:hypothetical protein
VCPRLTCLRCVLVFPALDQERMLHSVACEGFPVFPHDSGQWAKKSPATDVLFRPMGYRESRPGAVQPGVAVSEGVAYAPTR